MQKATFAAGCFWGIETHFRSINGVIETRVGYTGGSVENPSYEEVCGGKTGHAESVELIYNPAIVTYEELLENFWKIHDPTTLNKQGPDIGSQYRSAIFYHNEKQKELAEYSKAKLIETKTYKNNVVTEIKPASMFYPAEEYHQQYYEKHGYMGCKS
jgi:peptide-methionine (S)-S-oxide reductase